ncbi:MAG TPA: NTP transferase domain-containing protein [Thermoanaerobaculia bacterium]|nr:NTP transferase domain-containing protein [Thermoanaerobaculia bacterium]
MISAIVLAAGQAKRFGDCKQLLPINGKPLLQHVLDTLRQSKVDDVVVVLGAYANEIRQQIQFRDERIIANPDYEKGMSTSIQAGLRAIDSDAAFIVLADQPFVTAKTYDLLIDEYRRSRPKATIPTFNGFRGNPVLIEKSLFPEIMEIRGDTGARAIFGNHQVTKVPVDDRGVLIDIDTPEDVILSRADGEGSRPRDASLPLGLTSGDLLETIVDLRRRRQPFAMATVVRAERPTSSKPGDKAIIAPDGTLTGWIGGSCAHDIVVRNALEALQQGTPRFLTLSSSTAAEAKRFGVIDVPMQCYSGGVLDVFIEPSVPKPHMVIAGYETIARALVRIAKTLQFHVTVVDPLAVTIPDADQVINEMRLPPMTGETYVVVATHGRYDEDALEQAARSGASYIALVASPKRASVILQTLRDRGIDVDKIKSPAGLDIGAQGAEEIALSIVAEIVQMRRAGKLSVAPPASAEKEEAIDPICNMTVEIATAQHVSEIGGKRYYFCCETCKRTFEKSHVA